MAHDVFISYASQDKPAADATCARLEARGIRCWVAPRDVQPGAPYGTAIIDAINASRIMVLLLSSHANESIHIPKEVERAVSHAATIIPVRIEAVLPGRSLDYFIGSVHWLDAMSPPLDDHLESLADTILKLLPNDTQPSARRAPIPGPSAARRPAQYEAAGASIPLWKRPWIYAGLVVLLVAGGALVWSQQASSRFAASSTIVPASNSSEATPQPVQVRRDNNAPAMAKPQPSPTRLTPSAPTSPAAASSTALPGCWNWFTGGVVSITADGTTRWGPYFGKWTLLDRDHRTYRIVWNNGFIDTISVAADGHSLTGKNVQGIPISATRNTSPCN